MQRSNEEELDLFADLLEPAAEIIGDKEVADVIRNGGKKITAVALAIKNHKSEVIKILARIDGVPVEEYKVNAITLPIRLINLLNIPEVGELFTGQSRKSAASSGSATENIKDGAN